MEQYTYDKDIISFRSLVQVLWRWKWLISFIVVTGILFSILYAVKQPDVYRADIIATPPADKSSGGLSGMAGQLGGLAGLAGINIGGGSDKKLEQIKDLVRSRSFLQAFIERHGLIVDILAAKNWDKLNNKVIYDETKYSVDENKWVRAAPPGKNIIPTSWEAYPVMLTKIHIEALVKKNMFKISIDHYSPYIAKKWVELLLIDINKFYRERSKKEASDSIEYLRGILDKSKLSEVRKMIYSLLEDQIKSDMLSEVRREFVLETLSSPVLPEDKHHPRRAFICILGAVFSSILAILIALIANAVFPVTLSKDNT